MEQTLELQRGMGANDRDIDEMRHLLTENSPLLLGVQHHLQVTTTLSGHPPTSVPPPSPAHPPAPGFSVAPRPPP